MFVCGACVCGRRTDVQMCCQSWGERNKPGGMYVYGPLCGRGWGQASSITIIIIMSIGLITGTDKQLGALGTFAETAVLTVMAHEAVGEQCASDEHQHLHREVLE